METGTPKKNLHVLSKLLTGKHRFTSIILSVFCILLFLLILGGATLLNTSTVYKGVLIDGVDVGGYSEQRLELFLNEMSQKTRALEFTLSSPSFERNISISEMGLVLDTQSMIQRAYSIGRTGSVIERIGKILKLRRSPMTIEPAFDFESKPFIEFLDKICREVFTEVAPYNIVIHEDRVILCTGIPGRTADRDRLKSDIMAAATSLKPASIEIKILKTLPPSIDMETIIQTVNQEPVDAQFKKTSRLTYEIIPHQTGRHMDRAKLQEIVNYVENRDTSDYEEIILPVEFIEPDLTEESLSERLFRDTLSSYTTHFRTDTVNNQNRSINIGLAAQSIDGTLLSPGEVFSFNEIVGPRTPNKGYKTAHIFVEGQIRDGTGGGVCQVSTTLYNAVLKANLEVLERHNHMFTVGYVPLGQDAAVSYGYADLVFKNTTPHPILINAWVSNGNSLTFKLSSTNDYPQLRVKLAHKTISTTPRRIVYIDDNTLPRGTMIVEDKGMDGYVVDTYINVFNGDTLIREEKLHRSVYQMLPRKIIRGTAPAFDIEE